MPSETSSKASISPITINPDRKIEILAEREIEKIHEDTRIVLHKTGVRFPSQRALDIFAQAGADVDFSTEIVKIQPDLLMKTLDGAPAEFIMGSRGNQMLDVNPSRSDAFHQRSSAFISGSSFRFAQASQVPTPPGS